MDKSTILDLVNMSFKKGNFDICVNLLCVLAKEFDQDISNGIEYKHSLKHILFDAGFIKNPFGYQYNETTYENYIGVLSEAIDILVPTDSYGNKDYSNGLVCDKILYDLVELFEYTRLLYKYKVKNQELLDNNDFSNKSFIDKIFKLSLYIQEQYHRLFDRESKRRDECVTSGFETAVTKLAIERGEIIQGAPQDVYDYAIETINQCIKYIFYQDSNCFQNSIDEADISSDIMSISKDDSFDEYIRINGQYYSLIDFEAAVRYGYYKRACVKNVDGKRILFYDFENEELGLSRFYAICRRNYLYVYNSMFGRNICDSEKAYSKCLELSRELILLQDSSNRLLKIESFHPDKELIKESLDVAAEKIQWIELFTKPYYLEKSANGIKISDFILLCRYICSLSIVLDCATLLAKENDKRDYKNGLVICDMKYIEFELSRIFGFSENYSQKLLDCLVFHENNRDEDLFARPLVKVSKTQLLICSGYIKNLNIDRAIEKLLSSVNANVSKVGTDFEVAIREALNNGYRENSLSEYYRPIPNFKINMNKVEYDAFDNERIEFDVVSTLDDYLILTECKSAMIPYGYAELRGRQKVVINEAVEQLIRRRESVKKDWEVFKGKMSISLPENAYDDEHIILVACTNMYDFTPSKIGDVYITDESSYLRYFTAPQIEIAKRKDHITLVEKKDSLWKTEHPTAREWLDFLNMPSTVIPYAKNFTKVSIPIIPLGIEDELIYVSDYKLLEDPIIKSIREYEKS